MRNGESRRIDAVAIFALILQAHFKTNPLDEAERSVVLDLVNRVLRDAGLSPN
ncbi:MAG: hypothetical protein ACRD33_06360 [Candidatus Acidiferrales bacterium]